MLPKPHAIVPSLAQKHLDSSSTLRPPAIGSVEAWSRFLSRCELPRNKTVLFRERDLG